MAYRHFFALSNICCIPGGPDRTATAAHLVHETYRLWNSNCRSREWNPGFTEVLARPRNKRALLRRLSFDGAEHHASPPRMARTTVGDLAVVVPRQDLL